LLFRVLSINDIPLNPTKSQYEKFPLKTGFSEFPARNRLKAGLSLKQKDLSAPAAKLPLALREALRLSSAPDFWPPASRFT
jgi:hypothetical protein